LREHLLEHENKYRLINLIKWNVIVGYGIVEKGEVEPIYTYGEHELDKAKSKLALLNLLS
jgi:hypothetical protein